MEKDYPKKAFAIECDLTVDVQMFKMKEKIESRFEILDVLVNCAGKSLQHLRQVRSLTSSFYRSNKGRRY